MRSTPIILRHLRHEGIRQGWLPSLVCELPEGVGQLHAGVKTI